MTWLSQSVSSWTAAADTAAAASRHAASKEDESIE
jgi:hypothetical protein